MPVAWNAEASMNMQNLYRMDAHRSEDFCNGYDEMRPLGRMPRYAA